MTAPASVDACADLVRRGDPDRFLAAMAAPVAARAVLFAIYAFNLEVARAPWASAEPMIAEMRLQWWRDVVDEIATGRPVRRHEVSMPLAAAVTPELAADLDEFVAIRRWDIYRDPFRDQAHFDRYIDRGAATLMVVAARALGPADAGVLRDFGHAAGVANWLRAVPGLVARQRIPLPDASDDGIRALAAAALVRLRRARAGRHLVSKPAAPALFAGWQAGTILTQALRDPSRVARGRLGYSDAAKRLALMARAASGRW